MVSGNYFTKGIIMNRRAFMNCCAGLGGLLAMGKFPEGNISAAKPSIHRPAPGYLEDYKDLYRCDARLAALQWFQAAKFGLFMHFGLYSQLGRGEWVQFHEQIPVREYKKLKDTFKADNFDADFITDLACKAEMKYINITSKHHDGFCLFDAKNTDYKSTASPCKRDLIAELAQACQEKKLGLFLYYSLGADWQHPYFYPREFNDRIQPDYETPPPSYKWQKDEDFLKYLNYANEHIRQLLTNYGHIAGIWFDPLIGYYGRPDLFPINQTYAMIRSMSPGTLISFKQGVTGTEDFAAPERKGHSMEEIIRKRYGDISGDIAAMAWRVNQHKHNETCDTLQEHAWGYNKESEHKGPDQVMEMLQLASKQNSNLLLNTGPLGDGSIHPEDINTLNEAGMRIRKNGWPV